MYRKFVTVYRFVWWMNTIVLKYNSEKGVLSTNSERRQVADRQAILFVSLRRR